MMTNQAWRLPPFAELLEPAAVETDGTEAREQSRLIEQSLADLGVPVQVRNIHQGPQLTQFSLKPGAEFQLSQIRRLEPDIAVALSGTLVQLEEPKPDYPYITLVVRNERVQQVRLRQALESPSFARLRGAVKLPLGLDTFGRMVIIDLAAMPHLL